MREFILRASTAKTSPNIRLDNLTEEGKLDTVCNCIANAMHVSHHIRQDTVFHVVMDGPPAPPKVITFDGGLVKELGIDEKSIAKKIILALSKGLNLKLGEESNVEQGITVAKKSFEQLLKEKANGKNIFYLHKNGNDIRGVEFGENPLFILGDFSGVPKNTEKFIKRFNPQKIKLSPIMLFASHCIIIVHNELDRRIYGKL